jgi:hypothetical protein
MRPRTQSILIVVLLVLLVCQPMIRPVTNYLMLPMGRILAFGASAYVAATVSPVIGLLMALIALQAMSEFYVVEHMKGNATTGPECECPAGYTFDSDLRKCKNKEGKYVNPSACRCEAGYAYDINTGLCEQNSVMTSPIPAVGPAPAGTEEVTPTIQMAAPPRTSVNPPSFALSDAEKAAALGKE